jgi:hypothetical protein
MGPGVATTSPSSRSARSQQSDLHRDVRPRLRIDAGGGVRGLYAGLRGCLSLLRRPGLRDRLVLSPVRGHGLLPSPRDVWIPHDLQPVDRVGRGDDVEQRLLHLRRELRRRIRRILPPARLLPARRVPSGQLLQLHDQHRRRPEQRQHRQLGGRRGPEEAARGLTAPGEFQRVQPAREPRPRGRPFDRQAATRQVRDRTANGPNNVFADWQNVHRHTSSGWETRWQHVEVGSFGDRVGRTAASPSRRMGATGRRGNGDRRARTGVVDPGEVGVGGADGVASTSRRASRAPPAGNPSIP